MRIDSGAIGANGPRLSLSYAWADADKWKGDGVQRQHQVNARIVQSVGDGQFFGFVNYSDRAENDYQDLSAGMIDRLGYRWDNFAKDWDTAVRVAKIYQNQVARAAFNAGVANGSLPLGAVFVQGTAARGLTVTFMWADKELTGAGGTLGAAAASTAAAGEAALASASRCPAAAGAAAGVRCANFTVMP